MLKSALDEMEKSAKSKTSCDILTAYEIAALDGLELFDDNHVEYNGKCAWELFKDGDNDKNEPLPLTYDAPVNVPEQSVIDKQNNNDNRHQTVHPAMVPINSVNSEQSNNSNDLQSVPTETVRVKSNIKTVTANSSSKENNVVSDNSVISDLTDQIDSNKAAKSIKQTNNKSKQKQKDAAAKKRKATFKERILESSDSSDNDSDKGMKEKPSTRPTNKIKSICSGGCKTICSTDNISYCQFSHRLFGTVCHGCKKPVDKDLMRDMHHISYCKLVGVVPEKGVDPCSFVICSSCEIKRDEKQQKKKRIPRRTRSTKW